MKRILPAAALIICLVSVAAFAAQQIIVTVNESPTGIVSVTVPGPAGAPGVGVPTGGTAGQVLTKTGLSNYSSAWRDPQGGSGSSTGAIPFGQYSTSARLNATSFRQILGLGSAATQNSSYFQQNLGFQPLNPANNLSEVNAAAARANLGLAPVAASGSYADLTSKPTIPAAQVNSDWNAGTGPAQILNKPSIPSGSYTDLTNKPPTLTDYAAAGGIFYYRGSCPLPSGVYTTVRAWGFLDSQIICQPLASNNSTLTGVQITVTGGSISLGATGTLTISSATATTSAQSPTAANGASSGLTLASAGMTAGAASLALSGTGSAPLPVVALSASGTIPTITNGSGVVMSGASVTVTAQSVSPNGAGGLTLSGVSAVTTANGPTVGQSSTVALPGASLTLAAVAPSSAGSGGVTLGGTVTTTTAALTGPYSDTFSNSSLDTTKWQTILAGAGSITETTSLAISSPGGSGDAAAMYSKTFNKSDVKTYEVTFSGNTATYNGADLVGLVERSTPPAAGTSASLASNRRIWGYTANVSGSNVLRLRWYTPAGSYSSVIDTPAVIGTSYIARLQLNNTNQVKLSFFDSTGATQLSTTGWLTFGIDVMSDGNPFYECLGMNFYTDSIQTGTFTITHYAEY